MLRDLRQAIAEGDFAEIYISPDEGRLLQVLLRAIDARKVGSRASEESVGEAERLGDGPLPVVHGLVRPVKI